ncbi:pilus assembly protein Flp/PilA [Vibrio xiamenensis]|uniref:Pilus assembly protein Flp/PilA n=1 Tax=Vibrio xiamenensis TaxID=861298 RepID=A0A1G7W2W1_9VIBR|nr:fimbrial protein [Vibrio xiamenensis]SDG66049.1 pilus assembly protein Flp/PilA [Vibrio xiamenensis]
MNKLINSIQSFMKDEEGLTVVEYVVGAGLLVIALGVLFTNWGTLLQTKLEAVLS